MSTLTSVAAVAAAETLASMTKASQLFSIADTSVTSNLSKPLILDEVPRPTGKDTKANETSFQQKDQNFFYLHQYRGIYSSQQEKFHPPSLKFFPVFVDFLR